MKALVLFYEKLATMFVIKISKRVENLIYPSLLCYREYNGGNLFIMRASS